MTKDNSKELKIDRDTILRAVQSIKDKGWDLNPYTLADEAAVPRALIYRNPEFMEIILKNRPNCGVNNHDASLNMQDSNQKTAQKNGIAKTEQKEAGDETTKSTLLVASLTEIGAGTGRQANEQADIIYNAATSGPYVASDFNPLVGLTWKEIETVYHLKVTSLLGYNHHLPKTPPILTPEGPISASQSSKQIDAPQTDYADDNNRNLIEAEILEPKRDKSKPRKMQPPSNVEPLREADIFNSLTKSNPQENVQERSNEAPTSNSPFQKLKSSATWISSKTPKIAEENPAQENSPQDLTAKTDSTKLDIAASASYSDFGLAGPHYAFDPDYQSNFPGSAQKPIKPVSEAESEANSTANLDPVVEVQIEQADTGSQVATSVEDDPYAANFVNELASLYSRPIEPIIEEVPNLEALDIFDDLNQLNELPEIEIIEEVLKTEAEKGSKANTISGDELRELIKNRIKQAADQLSEAATEAGLPDTEVPQLNRSKFVGAGKAHEVKLSTPSVTRSVPPDIRKACLFLGLRPDELTKELILDAWKGQIAQPGVHPDLGGDHESAIYLNTAKDTLLAWLEAQSPKLGKRFGQTAKPRTPKSAKDTGANKPE